MEHLIPETLTAGQPQWILLAILAVAVAILVKGADLLVEGAAGVAYRLGISKVIVGATIVSLGTTSPECAVSVMAAWSGEPGLALGNAIGSIIADTGLIFGIGCLMTTLPADRFVLARQGWVQFGVASLLAALCYGTYAIHGSEATLGRWVGVLLLLLLAGYLVLSVHWSRQHPYGEPFQMDLHAHGVGERPRPFAALIAVGLVGLGFVLLSSRALILSVTELAEKHWHVPDVVIAATLVALGTSLPELVIGLTSILKGHKEILVGNVIGADVLNVLFVVGASAVAAPLPLLDAAAKVPDMLFRLHLPAMMTILVLFRIYIHFAAKVGWFRRWQGLPLILIYVLYTVLQYAIS